MGPLFYSWLTVTLTFLAVTVFFFYYFMTRKFNYWKRKGVPYSKPNVLFGSFKDTALFKTAPGEYFAKMYNKTNEDVYGLFAFHQPYLLIRNPELVRQVLVKDFTYFSDRTIGDNVKDDPAGTYNLFILKNPDWKELRSKISPVFSSGKLKQMFHIMKENGQELINYLKNDICSKHNSEAKEIAAKYTTDVISNCAFGIKSNCLIDEEAPFRIAGKKIFSFTYLRAIQFYCYFFIPALVKPFKMKFFDSDAANFLRKVFNSSMDQREKSKIQRSDLIDILVKIKNSDNTMQDDKLLAQGIVFLSAGFESSSSVISFSLYEMCKNKRIQRELRNDIKTVLARHNDQLTYECVSEMTYLDMVICETLRKYPPLPFIDRRCMKDYNLPGTDVVIDKGIPVCIPLLGLHYDPSYFQDPQRYDPERFSEDNKRNIVPGSYLPFGLGPRICIGERFGIMSSKLGLIRIISNFEVNKCEETPDTINMDPKSFLVTSSQGLYMQFKEL